jgi:hypothetical protein
LLKLALILLGENAGLEDQPRVKDDGSRYDTVTNSVNGEIPPIQYLRNMSR